MTTRRPPSQTSTSSPPPKPPRRRWLIFFALVIGGYFWFHVYRQTHPSLEHSPIAETAAPEPKVAHREALAPGEIISSLASAPPRLKPTSARALPAAARKPTDMNVPFKMIDGLAVAYGDVILGRPTEAVGKGGGQTEIGMPLYWGSPEIPYLIHPDLPNPSRVTRALDYLRTHTPVNFIASQGDGDGIVFEAGNENCMSPLGKQGGLQPIRLSPGCGTQEILHEILHALGFVHEQSRADRDDFIEIEWDDIEEKYQDQFALAPEALLEPMRGTSFDYNSILLYRSDTFAKPGRLAMKPRFSIAIAPVENGLSRIDIQRLNRMFRGSDR